MSLGVGMLPREFDCLLCQRRFTRICGDLILPEDMICDACLDELLPLEGDELRERLSQRLAEGASERDRGFKDEIIGAVQRVGQPSSRPDSAGSDTDRQQTPPAVRGAHQALKQDPSSAPGREQD